MATARTVIIEAPGGPDALKLADLPLGDPGPGEIRIRHKAIGLNFIDVYHRSGLYKLSMPHAIGAEGAGVVEAVGDGVTHLKPGDRAAYAAMPPGSYSEARVMPAAQVCPLPDGVSFEQAAAAMLKGMTVNYLFRRVTPIAPGDRVLFHAAAGGVGSIACQWARAEGIELIGTAGSDEKCALARDSGAAHVINYRTEDFPTRVRELTEGRGVDVVMDGVGKDTFDASLDCLRPLGFMISFGNASGPVPPVDLLKLAAKGSLKLTRQTLFTHIADPDTCQQMAAELFEMIASGKVRIRIDQRVPLEQVAEAHRALESRATTGATVLTL
ncbi:quinone oxidoreductase family protein [Frigidibacter sp. ROC022]|uniref:quinone oxidoreductase family protein n=1 Tax=Frigidibacter sp. ROC022 TaxID=2971796 RepID=UPI00215A33B7|nr:quinone oxidoreductase [Frigidibacter sp. ROC022]MCR8723200.1 quinone oxidoreductase [Frigidibacter sp. ROC022]